MAVIQTAGATQIFEVTAGSTAETGDWYEIDQHFGNLAYQVILSASSVGATAGTTVTIEVSNTTAVAVQTAAQTFALTCTTDTVSDGGTFATSMDGAWRYIRANMTSLTTSTAGSAGSPSVTVTVSAGRVD
jgi:hypothetical protein